MNSRGTLYRPTAPEDDMRVALVSAVGRYGRTSRLMNAEPGTFPMWITLGWENAPALNGMEPFPAVEAVTAAAVVVVVVVVVAVALKPRSRRSLPEA